MLLSPARQIEFRARVPDKLQRVSVAA